MQGKPPYEFAVVKLILFFARLLDNLCTQKLHFGHLHIVFYDYLWQSCGCIL
jgi:hypothetical protein